MGMLYTIRMTFMYMIGLFWLLLAMIQVLRLAITKRGKFFYKKDRRVPPICLQDPTLGVHYTVEVKRTKLHYVESGPKDGQLMLMVHGFPEFWYSWRHQIKEFNAKFRVISVDLRGYGGSSKPGAVSEYTVSKLVEDIKGLIEILDSKRKCVILAHDWGGALTWQLAAQYPHLVEKVVIMNCPHPGAFMKFIKTSWKQFMKSWYMFLVNMPYFPEWYFGTGDLKMLDNTFRGPIMGVQKGEFTREDLEAYKYTFNRMGDFTGPMNYIRASIRGLNKPSGKVKDVPVLLLWGTRDGALSTEMGEMSSAFATDFQMIKIEGASHWVQQDEPELINRHVTKFLAAK